MQKQFQLNDEQATEQLARKMLRAVGQQAIIYLRGELGVGKTSLVRYFIQALGHQGLIKSPTYTLVESYQVNAMNIYHYDLYRFSDPEELEFIGVRDYFDTAAIHFVEWPEHGKEYLPLPDLDCTIALLHDNSRRITLVAKTKTGINMLKQIDEA